jgi:hypothetical protein
MNAYNKRKNEKYAFFSFLQSQMRALAKWKIRVYQTDSSNIHVKSKSILPILNKAD